MTNPFAAPRRIRRIAARRIYLTPSRKKVILTLGVPQPVPGSDWGCAVQITGLATRYRRPQYVFGIDALQALHLAMQDAGRMLESSRVRLSFLGQSDDLMLPRCLPDVLPKRERDRIDAFVERELERYVTAAERRNRRRRG